MELDLDNKEWQDALQIINYTRRSLFLTGKAGTGKSTFLRYVADNTKKKHVILAPTGIAAINAGGSTLHSFFRLPFHPLLPNDARYSWRHIKETLKYTGAERKLIRARQKWNDAYEEEKAQMPTFAFGKATDTTWLQKLDELAEKHHISISQRQPGKEVEKGDVLELQIEVRNWEGALESLVKFMHELENTSEGMFDVGYLNFKPSSKKGYMRGSFTLTCAYMRED